MSSWTAEQIDSLVGKTVVVAQGTEGVGLQTVKVLTDHGAKVIYGSPHDLESHRSVFKFVDRVLRDCPSVDVLINNGDFFGRVKREETVDGHERTFFTNFLSHYMLTAQLFPLLLRSTDPRVINVGSLFLQAGKINLKDPDFHRGYNPQTSYLQSKLSNLIFGLELHRLVRLHGINLKSIPVHPGAIFHEGRPAVLKLLFQKNEKAALPLLFGATSIEARSGIFYGPDGIAEFRGNPSEVKIPVIAENMVLANRLWQTASKMTRIPFSVENSKSIGLH